MRLGIIGPDGSCAIDGLDKDSYMVMKKIFKAIVDVLKPTQLITTSLPWAYYIPLEIGRELDIPVRVLTPVSLDLVNMGNSFLVRFAVSSREGEDLNRRHTEFRKIADVPGTPLIYQNGAEFCQYSLGFRYTSYCDRIVSFPSYSRFAMEINKTWTGEITSINRKLMGITSIDGAEAEWSAYQKISNLTKEQFLAHRRAGLITNKLFQGIKHEGGRNYSDDETSGAVTP